ncbi:hypothetical protein BVJ53_05400 [Lacticaseibacillus chiayiensis]|uniref:NfeD-like C-terminal domain-containing protein n=1 Tax=Lacticaseibacillus chiayiensis TaxID=2100821 RepID=A0A4Q1U5P0_9LACO|nr:hypothetical protein [Lacticaseibacillus chiayiensis]QVI34028.1 hypothetical protein KG086_09495 [Lacticaseibacillus chiayiensis]RXT26889.1 hypothetical protein BVJ53_05400 [Lacticaseibacillus chiayiensis]RXT59144.1 hypothetical protein CHT97_02140 [Lacticaseibacillus chiayiensis]UYN55803.1 hypothetical protein OFW50_09960 [Lacticaseibacillus chiayiensis]
MVTWWTQQGVGLQMVVGVVALVIVAGLLWMLLSLVLLPLLAVLQRVLSSVENTTAMSTQDYLLGTLTLAVAPDHTGEVMVTGGGRARQTYPAKLWSGTQRPLKQGTKVVIIELTEGVAYVDAVAAHNQP